MSRLLVFINIISSFLKFIFIFEITYSSFDILFDFVFPPILYTYTYRIALHTYIYSLVRLG